jgi:hypothetical protein
MSNVSQMSNASQMIEKLLQVTFSTFCTSPYRRLFFFLDLDISQPHSSIPIQSIATNGPSLVSGGVVAFSKPRSIKCRC